MRVCVCFPDLTSVFVCMYTRTWFLHIFSLINSCPARVGIYPVERCVGCVELSLKSIRFGIDTRWLLFHIAMENGP